jgi:hypothetical protein
MQGARSAAAAGTAQGLQRVAIAARDPLEGIDQGAVEVEEDDRQVPSAGRVALLLDVHAIPAASRAPATPVHRFTASLSSSPRRPGSGAGRSCAVAPLDDGAADAAASLALEGRPERAVEVGGEDARDGHGPTKVNGAARRPRRPRARQGSAGGGREAGE